MVHVLRFDPRRVEFKMRGRSAPQQYRSGFAVVFFDFRARGDLLRPWSPLPGARALRLKSERRAADVCLGRSHDSSTFWGLLGLKEAGRVGGEGTGPANA